MPHIYGSVTSEEAGFRATRLKWLFGSGLSGYHFRDKNRMRLEILPGLDICLWECGMLTRVAPADAVLWLQYQTGSHKEKDAQIAKKMQV